ncbi:hypothetical protein JWG39_02075 [Desulforhopalus vacuolatus]|uniref:hypothetical protein n=1 Tax=Desulforhopalus vacuolatus TaxID=40414 RepID=UPI00196493FE|nr:hypothetical protein [Desulforhopalus vacuolatus]MBM9518603.1 hypothetical protein [Desulforhopalus vacuolatus]
MNIQFNRILCFIPMMVLSFFISGAFANDLGSPVETRKMVSTDYNDLVNRALPRYENIKLQQRFESIVRKFPNGLDTLKIRSLNDLEKVLTLKSQRTPARLKVQKLKDMTYEVNPVVGKLEFVRDVKQPMRLSKKVGLQKMSELKRIHGGILKKMGIAEDQIFFKQTSLLMSQSETNPNLGPVKKTSPVVVGITTDVIRAIDGILIEGNSVKLTTFSNNDVDLLTVKWPRFRFAPSIRSYKLKNRDNLKHLIAEKVHSIIGNSRGKVKMAVVLLPVGEGDNLTMVPAMKVAVTAVDSGEGVVFYENLLDQDLNLESDIIDSDSGGSRRM